MVDSSLDILAQAEDLVVIGKGSTQNNYVYGVVPSINHQTVLYVESGRKVQGFRDLTEGDVEREHLLSIPFYLRVDQDILRPRGLWLPGPLEVKALGEQRREVSRAQKALGQGVVVYEGDDQGEIPDSLSEQARRIELEPPFIIPFSSLQYAISGSPPRILVSIIAAPKVVIGAQAREKIREIEAFRGLGITLAGRRDGFDARSIKYNPYGEVSWLCGEAPVDKLRSAHQVLMDRKYAVKMGEEISNFEQHLQSPIFFSL